MPDSTLARRDVTLLDLVDTILQRGTSLSGDLVLSVADVDLVQVNLRALLASVDTVQRLASEREQSAPNTRCQAPRPREATALRSARSARATKERSPLSGASEPRSLTRPRKGAPTRPQHGAPTRIDTDPENVERGLAQLVLTVIELVRQLMERQALYRMESGSLDDEQVERLGSTFERLEQRLDELTRAFGLEQEDLNLRLGPLGDLL
jgi:Gas vesicle protein K/Gas vesicle protein